MTIFWISKIEYNRIIIIIIIIIIANIVWLF